MGKLLKLIVALFVVLSVNNIQYAINAEGTQEIAEVESKEEIAEAESKEEIAEAESKEEIAEAESKEEITEVESEEEITEVESEEEITEVESKDESKEESAIPTIELSEDEDPTTKENVDGDKKNVQSSKLEIENFTEIKVGESLDLKEGLLALDKDGNSIVSDVKITPSTIDTSAYGIYNVEYSVETPDGETLTNNRNVLVNNGAYEYNNDKTALLYAVSFAILWRHVDLSEEAIYDKANVKLYVGDLGKGNKMEEADRSELNLDIGEYKREVGVYDMTVSAGTKDDADGIGYVENRITAYVEIGGNYAEDIHIESDNIIVLTSDVAGLNADKIIALTNAKLIKYDSNLDDEVKVDYSNLENTMGAYVIDFYNDYGITSQSVVYVVDKYASIGRIFIAIENSVIENGSIDAAKNREELDNLLLNNANLMARDTRSHERYEQAIKVDSSEIKFDKGGKTIPGTYNVNYYIESQTGSAERATVSATVVINSSGNDEKLAQTGVVNFTSIGLFLLLVLLATKFKTVK